ncbi:hypothetical protein [Paenarthrobacter sp. PH39-S1]|uniref:hypothetical protein n=1 Tax=Paenarthrobacter sp. PH39-S1 TaxID=3046204 RepID=UPI0024B903D8|nr:hypothetical protein [Paenarthrobacter sp. PH39-S1]MDJ0358242.1 hypothetical protein [Paenarthrobacter sp. PH39-S1]
MDKVRFFFKGMVLHSRVAGAPWCGALTRSTNVVANGCACPGPGSVANEIDIELRVHMYHKLRIIVSLGIDTRCAELKVTGCLTADSCAASILVIRCTGSLGFSVHVDLSSARHIEKTALAFLQDGTVLAAVRATSALQGIDFNDFTVTAPSILPACPALSPAGSCGSVQIAVSA